MTAPAASIATRRTLAPSKSAPLSWPTTAPIQPPEPSGTNRPPLSEVAASSNAIVPANLAAAGSGRPNPGRTRAVAASTPRAMVSRRAERKARLRVGSGPLPCRSSTVPPHRSVDEQPITPPLANGTVTTANEARTVPGAEARDRRASARTPNRPEPRLRGTWTAPHDGEVAEMGGARRFARAADSSMPRCSAT